MNSTCEPEEARDDRAASSCARRTRAPPSTLPTAIADSRMPASAGRWPCSTANAGIATSSTPNAIPVGTIASISVRMPGRGERARARARRRARCATRARAPPVAKPSVPAALSAIATSSATARRAERDSSVVIAGPTMKNELGDRCSRTSRRCCARSASSANSVGPDASACRRRAAAAPRRRAAASTASSHVGAAGSRGEHERRERAPRSAAWRGSAPPAGRSGRRGGPAAARRGRRRAPTPRSAMPACANEPVCCAHEQHDRERRRCRSGCARSARVTTQPRRPRAARRSMPVATELHAVTATRRVAARSRCDSDG